MTQKQEKLNKLAREVLLLSRNTLLVNLRFLDEALSQFEYFPIESSTIMTDGKKFLYNPNHILECYKTEKEIPVRDYLHIVMHCVFRHMYISPSINRVYWDLACDIAVENVITELELNSAKASRQFHQTEYIEKIKSEVKYVTAERIYSYLMQTSPDPRQIAKIQHLFYADSHEMWYKTNKEFENELGLSSENKKAGNGTSTENSPDTMAEIWASISERIQVYQQTFGKDQGIGSGSLVQNLALINREKYDYTQFLKKFAVLGEAMKINDDEFDYIFYTYGLHLYKKMPLIEPLEYKEIKAIREFVIAIDTSGSTSGELVQKFIQKTYNILKQTESFFTKINLHIIQCDAKIQEDKRISCQDDFDAYIKTMKILGQGGTDFRPVFRYVEQLKRNKEFTNLKGLIYFTDGYGVFPSKKPDYDVAFVFVDDYENNPNVPPWAIKLVLQKNEI